MDENNSMSVSEALNHIQSWLNAGQYDKVIQGCTEILELEPGNGRALALMKKAEEARYFSSTPHAANTPSPKPAEQNARPTPPNDPLSHLEVENAPSRFEHESHPREESPKEKRQFFLAMLIPAVLVVLIGGSLVWYLADQKRNDLLADNSKTTITETPNARAYLEENDDRIDAMSKMTQLLEVYKAEHGSYPAVNQVETIFVESDFFSKVPEDPRQGEVDKAGKEFGYVYAVYSVAGKANQAYVLSALFEDSKGFGYPWTTGAPVKNYPNYRTIDETSATFIGDSKK